MTQTAGGNDASNGPHGEAGVARVSAGETVAEWRPVKTSLPGSGDPGAGGAGSDGDSDGDGDGDRRRMAPAAARNRDPILSVLREVLPASGRVLEIASGTGEHVVHFARHLPTLAFQPSDRTPEALESIAAWVSAERLGNVLPPLLVDLGGGAGRTDALSGGAGASGEGPVFDALICINMVHIAPWSATEALMGLAAAVLRPGAPLYLYGPYLQDGVETAEGNRAFDANLRARDPAWGLRRLEDVAELARRHGFARPEVTPMPANNLSVVFRRLP